MNAGEEATDLQAYFQGPILPLLKSFYETAPPSCLLGSYFQQAKAFYYPRQGVIALKDTAAILDRIEAQHALKPAEPPQIQQPSYEPLLWNRYRVINGHHQFWKPVFWFGDPELLSAVAQFQTRTAHGVSPKPSTIDR